MSNGCSYAQCSANGIVRLPHKQEESFNAGVACDRGHVEEAIWPKIMEHVEESKATPAMQQWHYMIASLLLCRASSAWDVHDKAALHMLPFCSQDMYTSIGPAQACSHL